MITDQELLQMKTLLSLCRDVPKAREMHDYLKARREAASPVTNQSPAGDISTRREAVSH